MSSETFSLLTVACCLFPSAIYDHFTPIAVHRQELRFLTYSVVLKGMAKAIWIGIGFIVILDSLEIPVTPVVAGLRTLNHNS